MNLSRMSSLCLTAAVAAASALGASCKAEQHSFHACAEDTVKAYVAEVSKSGKEAKPFDFSDDRWCAPRSFAGGVDADRHTLDAGHETYMLYCYACHGENGDGKGPSSYGLRPPPRNFQQGIFKFARAGDGLPPD